MVGFGKVVQGSEMRQGVVAFVEVGAAHRALGQALAVVVAGDVTDVSVLVGQEMPASSESDSVGLAGVDELFALFALLFLEVGQGGEEETQLSGGGDGLAVLVGVGVGGGEDVDLVGESVGGDAAQDVGAVELEVAEVGVDGGAGAMELSGDVIGGGGPGSRGGGLRGCVGSVWGWAGWT